MTAARSAAAAQPFVVRQSGIQGSGGFATRRIRKGERVVEYLGQRISWAEADRRYDDAAMKRHHTFLFSVAGRTVIDAAFEGNDARFINHSCEPNCEAVEEDRRIFIDAMRDIEPGEELTYDYAYARDKDTTEEDELVYACHCGSASCRGSILEPPSRKPVGAHHAAARQPHEHREATVNGRGGPPSKAATSAEPDRGAPRVRDRARKKAPRPAGRG